VSFYLDANVIVALVMPEALSSRADEFLTANPDLYLISNLGEAEVISAVSRRVRTAELTPDAGRIVLASLDDWRGRSVQSVEIHTGDIARAGAFLRRLDLPLLTPDAIHIAISQRLGATLVTFDRQMAASARALGADVAMP
jgi:uncharacterized protein